MAPTPYSALIAVADEKGYFKDAGLDVSMIFHPVGRECLELVSRGEAQVGTVACVAFAAKAPEDASLRVLGSIGSTVGSQIVVRKDRNIRIPSDLRGKRVGFTSNTTNDYFLYAFLLTENVPLKDITAVDIPVARQVEALVNGEVDAISAFEITAFEAKRRMGEDAVYWESQNNLAYHWLLAARQSTLRSPEPLRRLLKALIRAEKFAEAREEETKRIVARKWGFDPDFLQESWPKTRLNVSFSQSIAMNLQIFSTWHLRKSARRGVPPDVLNYLHTEILEEVAPGSVTIFR